VRFDVFHLGMPMIRDAILIGKSYPNVTLNLTWCPLISQVQTCRALDEIIDLVPLNKVIAFGGDYRAAVQKVWGHLVMARECVATALANRIEAGSFDRAEALRIARMWFHDNPARIYRIKA
jgi:predicted TIM-barrel fold metal-dependent hydrolase